MLSKRSTMKSPALLALAALFAGLALGDLEAGKPPNPPPAPVDGGVIYFNFTVSNVRNDLYSMKPDGSSKRFVIDGCPFDAEPSRLLHGGRRWFLVTCAVNPPAEGAPGETYPDCRQRFELFAVSDGGDRIQLSDDPTVQPNDPNLYPGETTVSDLWFAAPRWAPGDAVVSYVGRRWDPALGSVVETGIYTIEVGEISQFSQPVAPTRLPIAVHEVVYDEYPEEYGRWCPVRGMDWAPDGARIVYTVCSSGLWIADVSDGSQVLLLDHCSDTGCGCWEYSNPRWSPDGSALAFQNGLPYDVQTIETMAPDGSARKVILSGYIDRNPGAPFIPLWSPSGTHIVFQRYYIRYHQRSVSEEIYRCTASGADAVLLTGDLDGRVKPTGWAASP